MAGPVPLAEFVTLGQHLYVLMNPQNVDIVMAEIPGFIKRLESCGLHRTRVAADVLTRMSSIPYDRRTGLVGPTARTELKAYLEPIFQSLYTELAEQNAISINVGIVSQRLRQLPTIVTLTTTQSALLNETVNCVECGAYRAAQLWVGTLLLTTYANGCMTTIYARFNDKLTTHYLRKDGSPVFESIKEYDDFFTGKPDERTVIDACHLASLFGEKIRDNLRFFLRRRNDYAHPTFTKPSADQTNGYINDLLDTITCAPFH